MAHRCTNILLFVCIAICLLACGSDVPNGNNPPTITLTSLSKTEMQQGLTGDSIIATIDFIDVDGDIEGGQTSANIVIIDNRDMSEDLVSFPELPEVKGQQTGTLRLLILTTCCINPTSNPCEPDTRNPTNEYTYDIFIKDRNGNESNRVTTSTITLLCN